MFTHTPTHGRSHFVQSMMGNYSAWWADTEQNCEREIPFNFRFCLLRNFLLDLYSQIVNVKILMLT